MGEAAPQAVTTIEILKAGWPIVAALFGLAFAAGGLYGMIKSNRKDTDELKALNSSFVREDDYRADKSQILDAIKELKSSQEKSEDKLEKKLEKIATDTDRKLDKLFDLTNESKTTLAEIKGRLYPGVTEHKS